MASQAHFTGEEPMSTNLIHNLHGGHWKKKREGVALALASAPLIAGALFLLVTLTGCKSPNFSDLQANVPLPKSDVVLLREGDTVRISFPGAPNLNTLPQPIRRDGRISLPLVGEFKAAGLTLAEMQKELVKLYAPELQTKEVVVTLESSSFAVYVTGAVLRPGKIMSDRPITALQAIIEAGCDYTKANLTSVVVIRQENGRTERHTLNLKRVLKGQEEEAFPLKPADIVYVPERFSWF
jgi:polysaccharide biosynthesis/export protein